jgi:hypothetical protein
VSTKAIREALVRLDLLRKDGDSVLVDAAMREVEAIERAAKEWVRGVDNPARHPWVNAVVESIAKDAP